MKNNEFIEFADKCPVLTAGLTRLRVARALILHTPFGLEAVRVDSSLDESLAMPQHPLLGVIPLGSRLAPQSLGHRGRSRPQSAVRGRAVRLLGPERRLPAYRGRTIVSSINAVILRTSVTGLWIDERLDSYADVRCLNIIR